jgi:hypothetical protein
VPFLLLGDPADARPAVLLHRGEVLEALEVHGDIGSLLASRLLANREGLVDVIDAAHLQIVGTVSSERQGQESQQEQKHLHVDFQFDYISDSSSPFNTSIPVSHLYNAQVTETAENMSHLI